MYVKCIISPLLRESTLFRPENPYEEVPDSVYDEPDKETKGK